MTLDRVVLATTNAGKIRELRALVAEWGVIDVRGLDAFPPLRMPDENGATYAENAVLKARAVTMATGWPALADDSGLEVAGLDWGPGVLSARFAPDDAGRIARMLDALAEQPLSARAARYRAVVALVWPDGQVLTAEGECCGRIAERPEGREGFGYDPIFVSDELGRSLGTATADEKASVSHRARAVRALGALLDVGTRVRGCALVRGSGGA